MKTIKQLSARSKQLAVSAAKLNESIHMHMVDIIEFVKETGNVTPAADFLNMIGLGHRRDAIANWFAVHGGMTGSQDTETGIFKMKRDKAVPLDQIDIEAARAESPWTMTKEKAWNAFDLKKALETLVKRAKEKAGEEIPEGQKGHNIPADILAEIEKIVA